MNINEIKLCEAERQRCECWTRVMGYYRPIEAFNIGKKSEYADRKCFKEPTCCCELNTSNLKKSNLDTSNLKLRKAS